MTVPIIKRCPGTLSEGYTTYSTTCLRRVFMGRRVSHILPYPSPVSVNEETKEFLETQKRMSISGVQEKFSIVLDKNKLRLTHEGERGTYILKPIPRSGNYASQMPANEHLTMQLARQIFDIETAENALIFFYDGEPAYITKRFDVGHEGEKLAKEDFASLAGLTPQKDGEHYKYLGCYFDLFEVMRKYLPIYKIEASKLFRLIIFNYLFSNGDAHYKNFSILETPSGDFRLSPGYDLLNTHIHVDDSPFALVDGLLPITYEVGNIPKQLLYLAKMVGILENSASQILTSMLTHSDKVKNLIDASFLEEDCKRKYHSQYLEKLGQLSGQRKL